ncbi:LysM peptidoglycan-binding domain-containing protein [Paenibacillus gallinarum]|uniref:LysM peptidoglycan-binding domain-containing protein n=1 Tax=Paenibacillus gallinarum TaxID=2762232 RepID=A0ABR8T3M8_9BACL|nr:LysM peptidoglycan-binding domain-containing protein [Paenibacillus gallinarum]MBD7970387.1 LysM peptidoglycan-binding domain-containing protein [Paenibacillus gallinarum]
MSFYKIKRKKDSGLVQQDTDIIGKPPFVSESNIEDKKTAQQFEKVFKETKFQNDIYSTGTRSVTIASVVTIAGAALFFVLFFSMDVPSKIVNASASQQLAAASSVTTSNEQADTENSISSPRIIVLPSVDMPKDEFMTYLRDMSEDDVKIVLEAIQTQGVSKNEGPVVGSSSSMNGVTLYEEILSGDVVMKTDIMDRLERLDSKEFTSFMLSITSGEGSSTSTPGVDMVTSSDDEVATTLDGNISSEDKLTSQVDGSKRLKLVQDLDTKDYNYYVVEYGDTLYALSKSFDVSLGQIVELNGIQDADMIRVGEILLFPRDTKQPDLTSQ